MADSRLCHSSWRQLMPEDANDFSQRVAKIVGSSLSVDADAECAPLPPSSPHPVASIA